MEAEMTQYIVLLAVSIGLTFLVGRLLVTAGEPFLLEVFHDRKVTRSVNLLLSVLFHLITLGVLAIISVSDIGGAGDNMVQTFVVKLGVVLLTLGIAYGISMLVLIRVRDRRRASQISEDVRERLADRGIVPGAAQATPPAAAPPPGEPQGGDPRRR